MERSSGILMHITSLPSKYGIGTFGEEAFKFVDFLKKSGQRYWQILPLGPTGYGDSPYQCFSAFAGNPYFIDLDLLKDEGLLDENDYKDEFFGDKDNSVNYEAIFNSRNKVLRKAYINFKSKYDWNIKIFERENKEWLEDYSLYMALKTNFNLVSWSNWSNNIKLREKGTLELYRLRLSNEINYWKFVQYKFFQQWTNLKKYANLNNVKIIGDIPIYVAADSVDVWSNPRNFKLDSNMNPTRVAGCPPDAFSESGQLWGNPIYNWDEMEKDEYSWWISRVRESFKLYDVVRIDHFRGFESYWEIPYGEDTAINGKWIKGPALKLFNKIKDELGELEIIAEDLGILTDEVIKFKEDSGFPGMKILQFAFGGGNAYLPHNYNRNCVVYTGTHDNDTICGWYTKTATMKEVDIANKYLGLNVEEGINWGFIRGAWGSIADLAITSIQDLLEIGNEGRMNFPSTLGGNWTWRLTKSDLNDSLANKLYEITSIYERL
ncbi:4-alpha-glucanotransferase [Clostridium sp.]|uniref:4-alpha-glucanotransferase n=1 Tax=Clostridium sp. TaxID=1506 RepID=UPI003F340B36